MDFSSPTILIFSWNSDNIPLCDRYYSDNKGEILKSLVNSSEHNSPDNCYNPIFFESLSNEIKNYDPMIVALVTEGDRTSGTYFHSHFLPFRMNLLEYKLLIKDKLNNQNSAIRISIYIHINDEFITDIELSKIWVFNNNKFECETKPDKSALYSNASFPKSLVLYVDTVYGNCAFIAVQIPHNFNNQDICINKIDDKFIKDKNVDFVFLIGDFSTDYLIDKRKINDFVLLGQLKNQGIPDTYLEGNMFPDIYPNYNISKEGDIVNYKSYDEKRYIISWHDRIFYKNANDSHYWLSCLMYETVKGYPMLKIVQSRHLGVVGVFEISPYVVGHDDILLFSKEPKV